MTKTKKQMKTKKHKHITAKQNRQKQRKQSVKPSANPIDIKVFFEDYIPKKLVVREKQVQQIKECIDSFKKTGLGYNIQLQGLTGSGKTSTLLYCIRDYNPNLFVLVKGNRIKTIKEAFAQVGNVSPQARQAASDIIPVVIDSLKKNKKIIVIDDISTIPSYVELLDYLNSIYREIQAPIIVTTHMRDLLEKVPEHVRHTLDFARVDFEAYDAVQLYKIIKDRVELSAAKMPDESLHIIAAQAAQFGSARDALYLVKTSLSRGKTDPNSILELQHSIDQQTYLEYMSKMSMKEKQILDYCISRYKRNREPIPISDITKDLNLSLPRASQLVTSLESYNVISTRMESRGRYGRSRVISLSEEITDKVSKGEIKGIF